MSKPITSSLENLQPLPHITRLADSLERFLAHYIEEHYQIIVSNLDLRDLPRALKMCRVLLLGESHSEDNDRKDNGKVTNAFWQEGKTALLVEGDVQAKYVDLSITKQSSIWDLPSFFTFPVYFSYRIVEEENTFLFDQFNCILLIKNPIDFCEAVFNSHFVVALSEWYLSGLQPISSIFSTMHKGDDQWEIYYEDVFLWKLNQFHTYIAHYLCQKFERELAISNQVEERLNTERNHHFVGQIKEKLQEVPRIVTHSGGAHNYATSEIVDYLSQEKIPFLSMIPKRSYERLHKIMMVRQHREPLPKTHLRLRELASSIQQ